jgi:hypothetical protein
MADYIDECEFICTWNRIRIYYLILYYSILFLDDHKLFFLKRKERDIFNDY